MAVAIGLLLGDALGVYVATPVGLCGGLVVAASAAVFLLVAHPAWRRTALISLALGYGAWAASRVYQPDFPSQHVARAPMRVPLVVEGLVYEDTGGDEERAQLLLGAERLDAGSGFRATLGWVRVTMLHASTLWHAGDRVRVRLALRRPRNFGNPGEFDYVGHLARHGIYVTGFVEDDAQMQLVERVDGGPTDWLAAWRRDIGALFARTLSNPDAAVLQALIIGTEAAVPREVRAAFSRAGVSHVLSISGLHVGLVAAAGYSVCRWLLARSRWLLLTINVPKLAVALSVVPVMLYAGIAGNNVATSRSVSMIMVFLGAVLVDRQRHAIVSLSTAAILIVLCNPGASLDISFQLSFVAVLGLLLAMERFWPWWRQWEERHLLRLRHDWRARLWRPAAVYVAVSMSALAATTPLSAMHFNQLSLVAPLANALAVPLLGSAAVVLGLLAALTVPIAEPAARVCTLLAGIAVRIGVWLVERFATLPAAAIRIVTPTLLELAVIYAALLAIVLLAGRQRLVVLTALALIALGDVTWWYVERYHHTDLRVTFLSVGQGDSAVAEIPGGAVMVIDGGGLGDGSFDVGERVVAPFLWSRKIARVDYLVLSHPDADHFLGLTFLAQQFAPREFWSNGAGAASARFAALQHALDEAGARRLVLGRGNRFQIGSVDVDVLSPPVPSEGLSDNDRSLVVTLGFAGHRMMFTGDIESAAEANLVATADGDLASTVLKVPHHGSRTSSSQAFLDAVRPEFAIISAGVENRFHFPHPDVLSRYLAANVRLARTDVDGAVQVRMSEEGLVSTGR